MKYDLIIPAAGSATRLKGVDRPKPFLNLNGIPFIFHVIRAFCKAGDLNRIIIATKPEYFKYFEGKELNSLNIPKNMLKLVAGGKERVDSISNALAKVSTKSQFVAIHDAARPFIDPRDILKVMKSAERSKASILARNVIPTVKKIRKSNLISETIDRKELVLAETPQVFEKALIKKAYCSYFENKKRLLLTDDASLVEAIGHPVKYVIGQYPNEKITETKDLVQYGIKESPMPFRIGNGFDVHRLIEGRKLIIGGVKIPFNRGCLGHSDGDPLTHAVIDAILGAIGTKDIGEYFSDKNARYKGVSSLSLLQKIKKVFDRSGYQIVNIDSTIVCERPRLAPYKAEMIKNLTKHLGIDKSQLSIKAKTNEGLDSIGQGFAISVHTTALVTSIK